MDDRFYAAFLPPRVRVCGVELKRFTLWHQFLLSAMQSPFVSGCNIAASDLITAIMLCRQRKRRTKISYSAMGHIWQWRMRRSPRLLRTETRKFVQWLKENSVEPYCWMESKSGTRPPPNGPGCLKLVSALVWRAKISPDDAWDMPVSEALWLDAGIVQSESGSLHILPEAMAHGESFDVSALTDAEAMAIFARDLPPEMVAPSFDHWKSNKKQKGT